MRRTNRGATIATRARPAPRPGTVATAAATVVMVAVGLVGCDGGDTEEPKEDDHVNAALSGTSSDVPSPTTGDAAGAEDSGDPEGAPAPTPAAPAETDTAQEAQEGTDDAEQLPLGNYTVTLADGRDMVCMFRESQEADGFDWGCQANFHTDWPATRGGDANGVAYRQGGDPELYALLGNAATGDDISGELRPGSVTRIGDRFTVDLTEENTALITADGATARLTQESYELV